MDISIKLNEYSRKLEKYYNEKYSLLDAYLLKYLDLKNKKEQYEEVKKKIKTLITKIKKLITQNNINKEEILKFVCILYNIFNDIYESNLIDDNKSLHTMLVLLKLLNKLRDYLEVENTNCLSESKCKNSDNNLDNCCVEESDKSRENCPLYINCQEELSKETKDLLQNILCNFNSLLNITYNMIKLLSAYIIYLENKPDEKIIQIFVDDYNYNYKLLLKNIADCKTYENDLIKCYLEKTLIFELLNFENNFDFLKMDIIPEKQLCIIKIYIKKLRCIENLLENNIEQIKCRDIYYY